LGENGIGKSTLMKALAGEIDTGVDLSTVDISHKPQHLEDPDTLVRIYLQGFDSYRHTVVNPLSIEPLLDEKVSTLSGGQLQRVAIAKCLIQDADIYLLDEPSAYLDVTQRLSASKAIRDVMDRRETAAVVIDHDLLFLDYIANRLLVFDGEPGVYGHAHGPLSMAEGMNQFLEDLGVTFRRDERNNRPRINKPGSQKDQEQKRNGMYYYT
jgi:Predicted ATPase, RNase L inhibitor (RLI) homolog